MANTVIQLKHSTVQGNVPVSLANGEISINTRDGKIFYADPTGTIQEFTEFSGPAGLNQEIQFNDSGVLGANASLTFNKSTGYFKAPIIEATNNGNGTNFKVGDDAWIGDVNQADTLRIAGQQNSANAYVIFGSSDTAKLGRAGTGPLTYTGDFKATGLVSGNELSSTQSSGDEGGQVNLAIPATSTSLTGSVTIDVYQNKLRFFQGDSAKGAYIDLTAADAGVGTNLLNPSATPDTVARNIANAAFIQANSAFNAANGAVAVNLTQNTNIQFAWNTANAAYTQANTNTSDITVIQGINVRQNNRITYAENHANSAFLRANDSLNVYTGGTVTGELTVSGNVTTSQYFIGDGSKLTGLAPALQIYSLANTASGVGGHMVLKSLANYTVGTQNTTSKTVTTTPTLLTSFITDVGFPNITTIPSGDIVVEFDTQKASGVGGYYCYAEIYKRTSGGVETLLETTGNSSSSTLNSVIQQRVNKNVAAPIALDLTDRLVVKIYAVMLTTSASIRISFDGAADGSFTIPTFPASVFSFVPYLNATADVYLNSYSLLANTVTANSVVVASSGGYIQFGDGTKQYTANAGSTSGNSFGRIYTSNNSTFANATVSTDQITFTGVDGVSVVANSTAKTITFAGTPGAQGLTVDYGLVTESIVYSLDYGTL